jgi:hypothetical protein
MSMKTTIGLVTLAATALLWTGTALAGEMEGTATQKDLAARTLTVAGVELSVAAETRLEDEDGVRITLAEFPVKDVVDAPDGKGDLSATVVYETSGTDLIQARIIPSGG